jgi:hypothetical protein
MNPFRLIPLVAFGVVACLMCAYTEQAQAQQCKNGRCRQPVANYELNLPQLSPESCDCDCVNCPACDCHAKRYYAGGPRGPKCDDAKARGPIRKAARAAKAPLRAAGKVAKAATRPFKAAAKLAKALRPFKRCRS